MVDETELSDDELSHSTFSNDSDKFKQNQLKDQKKIDDSYCLRSTDNNCSNIKKNVNPSTIPTIDNDSTIVRF